MLTTGFDDPEVEVLFVARPVGSMRLAVQISGRVLRKHNDIPVVKIVDLCSMYIKCGLPDDDHNWNREKAIKDGTAEDSEDDKTTIDEIVMECRSCKSVFRMIDAKRKSVTTSEYIETTYFCPNCKGTAEVKLVELSSNVAEKIQTSKDIDTNKKYKMVDIRQLLGELIKLNTKANTSWGHYIHRECISNDKKGYETAYKGFDQKIYSHKQAWKRIMSIYNA